MTDRTAQLGMWLVNGEVRFYRNRQISAIRQALRLIFPIILLGSLADFLEQSWLRTDGYYYQTLHVARWLFQVKILRQYLRLISAGTLGLAGILMAFAVSFYLVVPVTRHATDRLMAGTIAVISLKFFNVTRASVLGGHTIKWVATDLGIQGILVGILVGVFVGNDYRWALSRRSPDLEHIPSTLVITCTWLGVMAALGLLWVSTQTVSLNSAFASIIRWPFRLPHFILGLLGYCVLNGAFEWLGVLEPLSASSGQSIESAQNLAAVLAHHDWQLPHPLTLHTVVSVYANLGGTGMMLALLLALFLSRPTAWQRRIGWLSLMPTLGNFNAPMMVGLPVILSPLLGIPVILAPSACITLSWLCIRLKWVPAVAYPLLTGTPGPLQAYLGTGGNWTALALSLADLILSTAIYYPFVRLVQAAHQQLDGEVA